MDNKVKLFFSIFILVFVAELGDKTQIAGFSFAAKSGEILSVILGASLALCCATLLAVLAGHLLAKFISKKLLKVVSGGLFLLTGIYLMLNAFSVF